MRYIVVAVALILAMPAGAWAQSCACTHYCHPTVFDDGDATCEATGVGAGPCSNQHCVDVAAAGSCVCFEMIKSLGENDLTAAVDFDVNSGTNSNYITYTTPSCDPDDSSTWAVWDGQSTAANCWDITDLADYLVIECQGWKNATGHNVIGANDSSIWRHNKTYTSGSRGLDIDNYHSIYNFESYGNSGFAVKAYNSVGTQISSHDGSSYGIVFYGSTNVIAASIFDTNLIGAYVGSASVMMNLSVFNSGSPGIELASGATGVLLFNNVIEGSGSYGMTAAAGRQTVSDYNVLYDNSTSNYQNITSGLHDICTENGNGPASSQFIDAASGNFTLKYTAEARGAGMPVLCPDCSRPSQPSIGAWQEERLTTPVFLIK